MMSLGPINKLNFDNFYYCELDSIYEPIDEEFIDGYVEYLLENGASDSTIYQNIKALKCFFNFLKWWVCLKLIQQYTIRIHSIN